MLEVVEHLLAGGWDVTYLTLNSSNEPRYEQTLARLGVPTLVGTGPDVADRLRELRPELAVVAFWHVAEQVIPFLRESAPGVRVIVDSIDLHFARNLRRRTDVIDDAGWVDDVTANELRRELNAYASADAVLTVSDAEASLLDTLGGDRLVVRTVPLGERVERSMRPFAERSGIVFIGNFRHLPNIEAVGYLCQEVLPRLDPDLLAGHPVMIVGNELDDRVRAAARHPGVRLVGWVPDVAPYLSRARVAVAPLLHGAGVKGKVLQSLMIGTPTVVSPLALEGTSLRSPEHVLVGDDAAALARAIATVLTDADEWQRLSTAGHVAASRDHAAPVVSARFAAVLDEVLAVESADAGAFDSRRWRRHYAAVRTEVVAVLAAHTGPDDVVIALSGGDDELAAGRTVRHFPGDEDGRHSFHPVDGAAAVTMLEAQRARGATHVLVPSTAYWWLHAYPEFRHHLAQRWCLVAETDEARLWTAAPVADDTPRVLVVADAARSAEHRLDVVRELPDRLEHYERIVMAPGRRLDAGWLDRLLGLQHRLRLDVAQAAAALGSQGVPPAVVGQPGARARRTRAVATSLPLVVGRRAVDLLRRAVSVLRHDDLRLGIIDDCPATPTPGAPTDEQADWSTLDVSTDGMRWQGLPRPTGTPQISVVIATFDRCELLDQCLAGFVDQTLPSGQWEIVVVDDGSIDATPQVVRRWAGVLPLRSLRIDHAGRSAAKNAGILAAAGDVVLLFDDDDVPDADLLLEHAKAHTEDPDPTVAVLGYTDFAAGIDVSPIMRFVTEGATMLFAYHEIADRDRVGWRYFWEGRVSCKRALLVEHGLHDPELEYSVDIELAFRLSKGPGLTVVHRRSAVSHMARAFTYEEFLARMEAKGRAQHRIASLHPDPDVREYCHIDVAERDWAQAAPTFDRDRARIAELEPLVDERPDLLPELHELYLRTLRGANRRGVLEAGAAAASAAEAPSISVVVPVWSVTRELAEMAARTVSRIHEVAQLPTEVIVVDNGSPEKVALDATVLVEHARNEGVAPAWNAGIAHARAATIVVLNSDVHVEPGWDVALHTAANDGRRIAFPHTDHGDGLGPRRADQAGTSGWCFALTREVYDTLGPFDESFRPAFFEDADYWTRAHAAGIELTPVPAAVVRHARRSSARHQPEMDLLFQAHRMKYSWKYGIEPTAPPPYWHRPVVEYP